MNEKSDSPPKNQLRDLLREALASLIDTPLFLIRTMCERGIPIIVISTEDSDRFVARKIDDFFLQLIVSFHSEIEDFKLPIYRGVNFEQYQQRHCQGKPT